MADAPAPSAAEMQAQYAALFWEIAGFTVPAYGVLVWVGALLTGIVFMQCVGYLQRAQRDPYYLKAMAIGITFLQVMSSIFEIIGHTTQTKLVLTHTIHPNVHLPWTDGWIILTSCLSGLISQCYFGRLVWRMTRATHSSRKWSLPWIALFTVLALAVVSLGVTSFAFFVRVNKHYWMSEAYIVNLSGMPVNLYISWLAAAAALDVTLSTILITNFVRDIRKDGFQQTNSILSSLAVSTLETFSLTAFIAVVDIVCAVLVGRVAYLSTAKLEVVCYFLTVVIARAYAASFIFTLRRHASVRDMRNAAHSGSGQHKSFGTASPSSTRKSPLSRFGPTPVLLNNHHRASRHGDAEAAIELGEKNGAQTQSGEYDDVSPSGSFADGVRVETTRVTNVERSAPEDYLPGRGVHASWKSPSSP